MGSDNRRVMGWGMFMGGCGGDGELEMGVLYLYISPLGRR